MDHDGLLETLLELERRLGAGDGDAYRERLTGDALVVVPGARLSREETAAAMDASPGWRSFELHEPVVVALGDDHALLSYRFTGRRTAQVGYEALMTSLYVRRDGTWRLALHQQTPL
ncbi:nuclear transport factor 2 family protein [Baekduia soli]|uniref:Nuclear transport factor 2 family protein n=1 Tax=Baekduia soli TaxID=496014 RepID=A0A5B8U9L7_9ACTN|nr:nuclear transport factor 2 family protein [Baekduia soli]QEC49764.1 nuclear transport factor 2 family protein [Baekduia soli]